MTAQDLKLLREREEQLVAVSIPFGNKHWTTNRVTTDVIEVRCPFTARFIIEKVIRVQCFITDVVSGAAMKLF